MRVAICFEACLTIAGSDNNCPTNIDTSLKVIGNDTVALIWEDYGSESSAGGALQADITTLLTVEVQEHAFVQEDPETPIMLQLTGVDFLCENNPAPPTECINRDKTFKIESQPANGKLYTTQNVSSLITTYPAILAGNVVYFLPDADYYNVDSHPLCFIGTKRVTFSKCPSESFASKCVGPSNVKVGNYSKPPLETLFPTTGTFSFCPVSDIGADLQYLTTVDLEGNVMGGGAVAILYSMKVGDLFSPVAPGMTIWVRNVNDAATLTSPTLNVTGWFAEKDYPLVFNNQFVQVQDSDNDTRVIQVTCSVADGLAAVVFPNNSSFFDNTQTIVNLNQYINGVPSMDLIGTITQVNKALTDIQFRLTNTRLTGSIVFTLFDISDDSLIRPGEGYRDNDMNNFQDTLTINIEFDVPEPELKEQTLTRIAVYAGIAALGIAVLGCLYGCSHAIFRRALLGERAAMWFVNNIMFTHIEDAEINRKVDPELGHLVISALDELHDERVRMERVQCCARALHVLPCCKFKLDSTVPKDFEEKMQKQAATMLSDTVARKHIPSGKLSVKLEVLEDDIFNWEKHVHVDDAGNERPYYFNIKTNESSWEAPSVKVKKVK